MVPKGIYIISSSKYIVTLFMYSWPGIRVSMSSLSGSLLSKRERDWKHCVASLAIALLLKKSANPSAVLSIPEAKFICLNYESHYPNPILAVNGATSSYSTWSFCLCSPLFQWRQWASTLLPCHDQNHHQITLKSGNWWQIMSYDQSVYKNSIHTDRVWL